MAWTKESVKDEDFLVQCRFQVESLRQLIRFSEGHEQICLCCLLSLNLL
jgi:hypothetical protein